MLRERGQIGARQRVNATLHQAKLSTQFHTHWKCQKNSPNSLAHSIIAPPFSYLTCHYRLTSSFAFIIVCVLRVINIHYSEISREERIPLENYHKRTVFGCAWAHIHTDTEYDRGKIWWLPMKLIKGFIVSFECNFPNGLIECFRFVYAPSRWQWRGAWRFYVSSAHLQDLEFIFCVLSVCCDGTINRASQQLTPLSCTLCRREDDDDVEECHGCFDAAHSQRRFCLAIIMTFERRNCAAPLSAEQSTVVISCSFHFSCRRRHLFAVSGLTEFVRMS